MINNYYYKLSDVEIVDPTTVEIDGDIIPLTTKAVISSINKGFGIGPTTFSRRLFRTDEHIWNELVDRQSLLEDVEEYRDTYNLLVVDGNGVGVVESTDDLDQFWDKVNEIKDNSKEVKINASPELIQAVVQIGDNHGVVIEYYLDYNSIAIYSVLFQESGIYVSQTLQVDKYVEDDMIHLLDFEVLDMTSRLVVDEYDMFLGKASKISMSLEELMGRLRRDLNIRVKVEEMAISDIHEKLSDASKGILEKIVGAVYDTDKRSYIQAPALRRSIEFVEDITYLEYYQLLSYSWDIVGVHPLHQISDVVLSNSTNEEIVK